MTEEYPGIGCLSEEKPTEATLKELEGLCADAFKYDQLSDSLELQAKEARSERDIIASKIKSILDYFGKSKYDSNFGTIEVRTVRNWNIPKTPESKKALFEYFQSKGIFWEYATVNSNSLRAYCNSEFEIAKEENRECVIPGLEGPKTYQTIAYRSKKGA